MSPRALLLGVLALLVGLGAWLLLTDDEAGRSDAAPGTAAPAPRAAAAAAREPAPVRTASAATGQEEAAAPELPPGFAADDPAVAWSRVDLEEVRRALPENRYWLSHMPTRDAAVLAEREREERHWREVRTRVESGNASEAEVDAYFEHKRHVYADGVEFTGYLIEHYADVLDDRDVRLLGVANRLHQARLVELPRVHFEAQQRRERAEAARRAWQEQQAAFERSGDDDPGGTPGEFE